MAHSMTHTTHGVNFVERLSSLRIMASPGLQAFWILRLGYATLAIVAGLDKFFGMLVSWEMYLASWIPETMRLDEATLMYGVGVVEIAAGIGVLVWPRVMAYVVAAWLAVIVINLLSMTGYYDIALRDIGLMLGALALARLSRAYAPRVPKTAS